MKKFPTNLAMLRNVLFHSLLIFVTFFSFVGKGWGQVSNYTFVATTGNYTNTSGQTSITGLGQSVDDGISSAINIGFTFNYDGTNYTQFKASSNGWMTFNTAITSPY